MENQEKEKSESKKAGIKTHMDYNPGHTKTNEEKTLELDGVFVEIGMTPNSQFVKDLVEVNPYGEIVIDHKSMATSVEGIFAAGDVADVLFRQNNISAGQGSIAALSAQNWIQKNK